MRLDAPTITRPSGQRRLGEVLVSDGVVTPEQLASALAEQQRTRVRPRVRLGEILVDAGVITEEQLAAADRGGALRHLGAVRDVLRRPRERADRTRRLRNA
jgi:hypothetical protein